MSTSRESDEFTLNVFSLTGIRFHFSIKSDATLSDLKGYLIRRLGVTDRVIIRALGTTLLRPDTQLIRDYELTNGSCIYLVNCVGL